MNPTSKDLNRPNPPRILLVDDNEVFRDLLDEFFRGEGYRTKGLSSGEDAMCALENDAYDIALVDLNLAGWISGLDLLRGIRGRYPDMKVIVCSGQNDPATVAESLRLGALDFIGKPVDDLAVLLSTVTNAVAGKTK